MSKSNYLDLFITKLFSSNVKDPCFYQLQFKNKSLEDIFKILLKIYIKGLSQIYFPGKDEIIIDKLTGKMILKMELYMKSLGFQPNYNKFHKRRII